MEAALFKSNNILTKNYCILTIHRYPIYPGINF